MFSTLTDALLLSPRFVLGIAALIIVSGAWMMVRLVVADAVAERRRNELKREARSR